MKQRIIIHEKDNVAVQLTEENGIPAGHKVALCAIKKGEAVIKYGHRIGFAAEDIEKGAWVHTHNVKTALNETADYVYAPVESDLPEAEMRTFRGFVRADGRVGVRNEIWILPTVGCVSRVAESLARRMNMTKTA